MMASSNNILPICSCIYIILFCMNIQDGRGQTISESAVCGKCGGLYMISGNDSYIYNFLGPRRPSGDSSSVSMNLFSFTITVWVLVDHDDIPTQRGGAVIVRYGNSLRVSIGKYERGDDEDMTRTAARISVDFAGSNFGADIPGSQFDGRTWRHLALTWRSSSAMFNIYLSGSRYSSTRITATENPRLTISSSEAIIFGNRDTRQTDVFRGGVGHVRMFRSRLSIETIAQLASCSTCTHSLYTATEISLRPTVMMGDNVRKILDNATSACCVKYYYSVQVGTGILSGTRAMVNITILGNGGQLHFAPIRGLSYGEMREFSTSLHESFGTSLIKLRVDVEDVASTGDLYLDRITINTSSTIWMFNISSWIGDGEGKEFTQFETIRTATDTTPTTPTTVSTIRNGTGSLGTDTTEDPPSMLSLPVIIGIALGSIGFVVLAIVFVVFTRKKKSSQDSDDGSTGRDKGVVVTYEKTTEVDNRKANNTPQQQQRKSSVIYSLPSFTEGHYTRVGSDYESISPYAATNTSTATAPSHDDPDIDPYAISANKPPPVQHPSKVEISAKAHDSKLELMKETDIVEEAHENVSKQAAVARKDEYAEINKDVKDKKRQHSNSVAKIFPKRVMNVYAKMTGNNSPEYENSGEINVTFNEYDHSRSSH